MWQAQFEYHSKWYDMNFDEINIEANPGGKIMAAGHD